MDTPPGPLSQTNPPPQLELSMERLQTHYANLCRGMMGGEEIVLDFGFNPNSAGKVTDEPAYMSSRVILTIASAVRLHQLLHALLAKRQEAVEQAMARQKEQAAPSAAAAPPAPSE